MKALSKSDKRVIKAFVDGMEDSNDRFGASGNRLDGFSMGKIASWQSDGIHFHDLGGKKELQVHRYIRKIAPKNWIASKYAENPAEVDEIALDELKLYIDNDGDLYYRTVIPIRKNLVTKIAQKKYSSAKAPQAFMYLVEAGAKKYAKEFGGTWHQMFDITTRRELAKQYALEFESDWADGEYKEYLPKKYRNPSDCGCGCNGVGRCKNPSIDDWKKINKNPKSVKQLKSFLCR